MEHSRCIFLLSYHKPEIIAIHSLSNLPQGNVIDFCIIQRPFSNKFDFRRRISQFLTSTEVLARVRETDVGIWLGRCRMSHGTKPKKLPLVSCSLMDTVPVLHKYSHPLITDLGSDLMGIKHHQF